MKWVIEICGLEFGCENWIVKEMFGKLFDFFIILGYERILCFEFKFIIFKFQNYLIYLKIKSTYNIICFSRPKPKKGPKLEKTTTQKYLQLFWRFNPKYFH